MENIIDLTNVTKYYGSKKVLDELNLSITKGKIVGILGPNGSGKTTLIKILVGLLRQNSGEVLIDGKSPGTYTKSIVSYLPDRNYIHPWMKIKEAIRFFKDFYSNFNEGKANELLEFMELDEDMKIKELSKGMQEKLNLLLVLSRDAKVYILDEPIAGVDPVARDHIINAIVNNYNNDRLMIITTHLVRDMENLLEDVLFLKDGKVKLKGNVEDLREQRNNTLEGVYKEVFGKVDKI